MQAQYPDTPQVHPDIPPEMRGTRDAVFFLWNRKSKPSKPPQHPRAPQHREPPRNPVQAHFGPQIKVHVKARPLQSEPAGQTSGTKDDFIFT